MRSTESSIGTVVPKADNGSHSKTELEQLKLSLLHERQLRKRAEKEASAERFLRKKSEQEMERMERMLQALKFHGDQHSNGSRSCPTSPSNSYNGDDIVIDISGIKDRDSSDVSQGNGVVVKSSIQRPNNYAHADLYYDDSDTSDNDWDEVYS
ncbi:hypothetical protein MP638_005553 [Amoeboaphelidium occidentale]|nr:hypothetical protein MP638_005553 [Amoeboaphelidium occidentale]